MKKAILVLALAAMVVFATASVAFANFGPHGGYALDTDACAGCHRAHTSFSELTWNADPDGAAGPTPPTQHSALLVSSASTIEQFCYACHGDGAPGASTNVQSGVFDSGPSGAAGVPLGGAIMYQTSSSFNATLNGGGFDRMPSALGFASTTSMHNMEDGAATDPMWGAGSSAPAGTNLTCTGCHDVHGSSNYRLLKDTVNGHTVGGYVGDEPRPYVTSAEIGYPTSGWLKHDPGASQMTTYLPNYTSPVYKWGGQDLTNYPEGPRSMSTWCSTCHEAYNDKTSNYNYLGYEAMGATRTAAGALIPGGGTALGNMNRHRHPVDTTLGTVTTANGWGTNAVTSTVLPLEDSSAVLDDVNGGAWSTSDYLGCLTCHRAHGVSSVMTGWATSRIEYNAANVVTWYPVDSWESWNSGVNPNFSSALLRTDNRGVCERCHNK